jgi:hypothetical protein
VSPAIRAVSSASMLACRFKPSVVIAPLIILSAS